MSIGTTHCSRRRPAVYGYSTNPALGHVMVPGSTHAGISGGGGGGDGSGCCGVDGAGDGGGGDGDIIVPVSAHADIGGGGGYTEKDQSLLHFTMLCKPSSLEDTLQYWG